MEFIFASEMREVLDAALTEPEGGFDQYGNASGDNRVSH